MEMLDSDDDPHPFIIDTSTPESLERDFYAWLHASSTAAAAGLSPIPPPFMSHSSRSSAPIEEEDDEMPVTPTDPAPLPAPEPVGHHYSPLPSIDLVVFGGGKSFLPPAPPSTPLMTAFPCTPTSASFIVKDDVYGEEAEPLAYMDGSLTSSPANSSASFSSASSLYSTGSPSAEDIAIRSSGRNQLGRTYSPGLPLSMNEREFIVSLYQGGWKICDISRKLCVTHSCVSKILNRYRTTGSVKPKEAKEGRSESPLVCAIRDYRARLGISRQSEIREQLINDGICTRDSAPSRSSINHILRTKLDIKRKIRSEKRSLFQ